MKTKFIEATNREAGGCNYGKFMVGRFDDEEWRRKSAVYQEYAAAEGITEFQFGMLQHRGWSQEHILVQDLQTGEGAIFRPGGFAAYDLNEKHKIWVCPLFEPFLTWLYKQDLSDLNKLPAHVTLKAPSALYGHRRNGGDASRAKMRPANYEKLSWQEQWDIDKRLGILD